MAKKKSTRQYYTVDERIRRVWDAENIKDLMARRSFYIANEQRREELNKLWVTEPKHRKSASFGSNWGYYVGMEDISNYYVVQHDQKMKAALAAYCEKHPEVANNEFNQGYGCYFCHPMSTPLVVISGDGETAKGMWYSIGNECIASGEDEADCRWYNERVAADFVKEDGEWKIWHLVVANDLCVKTGENVDEMPSRREPDTYLPEVEFKAGKPTVEMLTHNSIMNWSDGYPPEPYDYFRFDEEESYGPLGHPNYEG